LFSTICNNWNQDLIHLWFLLRLLLLPVFFPFFPLLSLTSFCLANSYSFFRSQLQDACSKFFLCPCWSKLLINLSTSYTLVLLPHHMNYNEFQLKYILSSVSSLCLF
jgi:hypothetical protein